MSLFGDVVDILDDIADNVLGVEVDVIHTAWLGQSGFGVIDYATPVTYRAIVVQGRKQVYAESGMQVWTKAYIAFLQPLPDVTPNTGQQRTNPIDPNDILTLPDGSTGVIIKAGGLLDGETSRQLYSEVYLGDESGGGE